MWCSKRYNTFSLVYGNRSILRGINIIGLRRKKVSNDKINILKDAYKYIFKNNEYMNNIKNLDKKFLDDQRVQDIITFIKRDKKRPICTPFSSDESN